MRMMRSTVRYIFRGQVLPGRAWAGKLSESQLHLLFLNSNIPILESRIWRQKALQVGTANDQMRERRKYLVATQIPVLS